MNTGNFVNIFTRSFIGAVIGIICGLALFYVIVFIGEFTAAKAVESFRDGGSIFAMIIGAIIGAVLGGNIGLKKTN